MTTERPAPSPRTAARGQMSTTIDGLDFIATTWDRLEAYLATR